jgi:hypothetical protein
MPPTPAGVHPSVVARSIATDEKMLLPLYGSNNWILK